MKGNDEQIDGYVEFLEEMADRIKEDDALIEDAIMECIWRKE